MARANIGPQCPVMHNSVTTRAIHHLNQVDFLGSGSAVISVATERTFLWGPVGRRSGSVVRVQGSARAET